MRWKDGGATSSGRPRRVEQAYFAIFSKEPEYVQCVSKSLKTPFVAQQLCIGVHRESNRCTGATKRIDPSVIIGQSFR
jgi:hypothetical protein